MKTLASIMAGAVLAAGILAPVQAAGPTRAEKNEAKLAKMLEGRVAGEPVRCISALRNNALEVIEHVGVVYDGGETIWVARATDPRALGWDDALVIERQGGQLCTTDMVRTFDRSTPHFTGVVFFDDFVPYTRG